MALQKNKVKFGLNKVHYAKITAWSDEGVPTFATPVRCRFLSMPTARTRTFLPITACTTSSTTMLATRVTLRWRSSPPISPLRSSVSSSTARVFLWSVTMPRPRSLHCSSSSTATRTTSVMCCTAARHPVPRPRVPLRRSQLRSRRRLSR